MPELIFRQVVMQVPFFVYSRILGYCVRAAQLQRGFGGDFCLGKSRTEMISLQFWLNSIEILASKSSDAYQGRAPRETLGKIFLNWRGL